MLFLFLAFRRWWGAHLPLASMELWFCPNVLDIDSGLQVVLLLFGEVCSIL